MTIGEGNGTPLHYSCLETPTDGGAWWAAVHGITESWMQGTITYVPGSSHSSRLTSFSVRNVARQLREAFFQKNSEGSFFWASKLYKWRTEGNR